MPWIMRTCTNCLGSVAFVSVDQTLPGGLKFPPVLCLTCFADQRGLRAIKVREERKPLVQPKRKK